MEIVWVLIAGCVSAFVFFLFIIFAQNEPKPIVQENDGEEEIEEDGDYLDIRPIIWGAYKSLKDQRAGGYGPWLSACLSMPVSAGVALQALCKTRDELTGSRFNLDGLKMAIVSLEEIMGVWD